MDIIADLLALVTIHLIKTAFDVALDQVTQEAVQLYATVVWSRETPAAQATGVHTKVAAVFLHHHIGGNFRGTKEAMFALVDGAVLTDAMSECRIVEIPARGEFLQADAIGSVPIHLVGAHMHKDGLRHMPAG